MGNKLDQLFRENLDQLEVKPSADSWGKVQHQLAGKKGYWFSPMKIAAAVLVVVAATVLLFNDSQEQERQALLTEVDHPAVVPTESWTIEVPSASIKNESAEPPQPRMVADVAPKAQKPVEEVQNALHPIPLIAVAGLNDAKLDADLSPRNLHAITHDSEIEEQVIRITYIASSVGEADIDENRLNKIIAIVKEVTSSGILADIREAKDNLFRKNN